MTGKHRVVIQFFSPWENDGKSAWHFVEVVQNNSVMNDSFYT